MSRREALRRAVGVVVAMASWSCAELEHDARVFNEHVVRGISELRETAAGMGAALHPVEQGQPADLEMLRLTHASFRAAVFLEKQQLKEVVAPSSPEAAAFRKAHEDWLDVQWGLAEGPYAELVEVAEAAGGLTQGRRDELLAAAETQEAETLGRLRQAQDAFLAAHTR